MKPKEKAKDLFDKMCLAIATEKTQEGYFTNIIHAKQCALIAVDEITSVKLLWYQKNTNELDYWQEIKNEIEKL